VARTKVLDNIITMVRDPDWLGDTQIAVPQIAMLKGINGLAMTPEERDAFEGMTEGRKARRGGYFDATMCIGQRSGKTDKVGCNQALYQAMTFNRQALGMAPGEIPYLALIAQDKRGAAQIFGYIEGKARFLEEKGIQVLADTAAQSRAVTGNQIRFASGAVAEVFPAKKAATRNKTLIFALLDEVGWWETEELAVDADLEIYRAARSRMITVRQFAKLIIHSSPFLESGILHKHYLERVSSKRLFAQAPAWVFRPTLLDGPQGDELRQVQHDDPEAYSRDYGAEFGKPGGSYYSPADIDRAMGSGRPEIIQPQEGHDYHSWIDAAFKHDLFAAAIGYRTGDEIVYPLVTWWEPRRGRHLDSKTVAAELAAMLKPYRIDRVRADQYADVLFADDLSKHGITLMTCAKSNEESRAMHANFRAALRRGIVNLPKHEMIRKDMLACRETGSGGSLKVAAPPRQGFHDDITKVLAALAQDLLPVGTVSVIETNARAIASDRMREGLAEMRRRRGEPEEFGGDLMRAAY
jgi:hypothetical protein